MVDDLTIWRSFYSILKTPTLAPAVPRMLQLGRATASDYDVIAMLDAAVGKWREEQTKGS